MGIQISVRFARSVLVYAFSLAALVDYLLDVLDEEVCGENTGRDARAERSLLLSKSLATPTSVYEPTCMMNPRA